MKFQGVILLGVVLLVFEGCAGSKVASPAPVVAASEDSAVLPFTIKIAQEVNDGQALHISGEILTRDISKLPTAVMVLTVLKSSETISEKAVPLKSIASVDSTEPIPFAISSPAGESTDYQLELLWGAEAQPYLSASAPESALVAVEKVRLEALPCQAGECSGPMQHVVRAELLYRGDKLLESVELGLSFSWVAQGSLDFHKPSPQNEEKLSLKGLSLKPGERKSLSLSIATAIPERKDAKLEPILRIISYDG